MAMAMDDEPVRFAVTPWRHRSELLQLRTDLYRRGEGAGGGDMRAAAVNKVFAWRARKTDLPLLLDSTADLVHVVLVDEAGALEHNALRLLYATAISRFMTGLSDTQIDLTRDRPSWFPPGKSLQLPTSLLETRHCIVHRHLPTLAELKRASTAALVWLWDWYWAQLDDAFSLSSSRASNTASSTPNYSNSTMPVFTSTTDTLKNKLHALLRAYIKERKQEIKARGAAASPSAPSSAAARSFVSTYTLRFAPNRLPTPSSIGAQSALLCLLVGSAADTRTTTTPTPTPAPNDPDALLLPAPRKPLNMPGALAIWSPLLRALCASLPSLLPALLSALTRAMNSVCTSAPHKEALCAWAAHVACDDAWEGVRAAKPGVGQDVLAQCFSAPEGWNLRLAERVLESGVVKGGWDMWGPVLEAAREDEGGMVVDGDGVEGGKEVEEVEREKGVERDGDGVGNGDGDGDGDGGQVKSVLVERAVAGTEEKKAKAREQVKGPVKVLGLWKPRPIGTLPEGWDEDE